MSKQRHVTHYILILLITHDIIRRITVLNFTVQWWTQAQKGPGSNRSRDAVG